VVTLNGFADRLLISFDRIVANSEACFRNAARPRSRGYSHAISNGKHTLCVVTGKILVEITSTPAKEKATSHIGPWHR
jgi:hypothetical protein